ncbi:MAG: hypothetical protein VYB38_11160 [Bacteroidota bacterium]|nr:hypothetical protein [Bacteroidota bacterium]
MNNDSTESVLLSNVQKALKINSYLTYLRWKFVNTSIVSLYKQKSFILNFTIDDLINSATSNLIVMKKIPIIFFLNLCMIIFAQNHRYNRYDGPKSPNLGFKSILVGGLIWGVGMLIIMMHKKNERGVVENSSSPFATFAGVICVIGGLIAAFGLIMIGF